MSTYLSTATIAKLAFKTVSNLKHRKKRLKNKN
jgi:CRISPR/Cas system CMR-associated protein Cmr5 small subunit